MSTVDPRVRAVLLEAADIIEKPGAWIQGDYARIRHTGCSVQATDPRADCFCGVGALMHVAARRGWLGQGVLPAASLAAGDAAGAEFFSFNDADGRTAAEVAAVLRKAAGEVAP